LIGFSNDALLTLRTPVAMAAIRSKIPSVGSAQWILSERHQANHFVDQEVEEFRYSVRNELEWLNEHMADVFRQDGV
jgi:hypothetical protein